MAAAPPPPLDPGLSQDAAELHLRGVLEELRAELQDLKRWLVGTRLAAPRGVLSFARLRETMRGTNLRGGETIRLAGGHLRLERGGGAMKAPLTALGIAIVLGATAAAASAHGGPPTTSTTTVLGGTETVPGFDCDGNEGVEDHVFNGVVHVTEFADGHSHITLTQAGTWNLDLPAPLPDYTGRYVIHESHTTTGNVDGLTIAVPFIGRGSDGSHFRLVFTLRLTVVGGTVVVERVGFQCSQ